MQLAGLFDPVEVEIHNPRIAAVQYHRSIAIADQRMRPEQTIQHLPAPPDTEHPASLGSRIKPPDLMTAKPDVIRPAVSPGNPCCRIEVGNDRGVAGRQITLQRLNVPRRNDAQRIARNMQ